MGRLKDFIDLIDKQKNDLKLYSVIKGDKYHLKCRDRFEENKFPKIGNEHHKSCSDCRYYLVGRFPDRVCAIYKNKFMFGIGTSPEDEMDLTELTLTTADDCDAYTEDILYYDETKKVLEDFAKLYGDV